MPRAKVTFFGGVRAAIPVSYESRYAHLITTLGVSLAANRAFEFGRPDAQGKRWNLTLTLGEGFSKALRTSAIRGNFPGDTTGCRTTGPHGLRGQRRAPPRTTAAAVRSARATPSRPRASSALSRGRYSLSVSLIVLNEFKYSIDAATTLHRCVRRRNTSNQIATGRSDITWGIISAGYDITDHFALSVGLASYQPALDSRYQTPAFSVLRFLRCQRQQLHPTARGCDRNPVGGSR